MSDFDWGKPKPPPQMSDFETQKKLHRLWLKGQADLVYQKQRAYELCFVRMLDLVEGKIPPAPSWGGAR